VAAAGRETGRVRRDGHSAARLTTSRLVSLVFAESGRPAERDVFLRGSLMNKEAVIRKLI
jgi:hypothetical protein